VYLGASRILSVTPCSHGQQNFHPLINTHERSSEIDGNFNTEKALRHTVARLSRPKALQHHFSEDQQLVAEDFRTIDPYIPLVLEKLTAFW
jgi:hypothetical protein